MADVQTELKNGYSVLINDSKSSTPNSGLLHESLTLYVFTFSTLWEWVIVPSSTGDVTAY